jgi:isochorismate hydrolase
MSKNIHRQWGQMDMLYYCPQNKVVWQYDRTRKIHVFKDMPTYGLDRKELPNGKT